MPDAREWTAADAAELLAAPGPNSHKYSRGVLAVRTGSRAYPGAAVLGVEAAWRTGIGLLRYVPPVEDAAGASGMPGDAGVPSPAALVISRRPETLLASAADFGHEDAARCDAWMIGSGTDPARRPPTETEALRTLLRGAAPIVVDAGALGLLAELASAGARVDAGVQTGTGTGADIGTGAGSGTGTGTGTGTSIGTGSGTVMGTGTVMGVAPHAPIIATPHFGEFRTLWRAADLHADALAAASREDAAAILAQRLGITVLLKGSRTIAAAPSGRILAYGPATPWLATAGTGDVLAGILGALVASHAAALTSVGILKTPPSLSLTANATRSVTPAAAASPVTPAAAEAQPRAQSVARSVARSTPDTDLLAELGVTAALLHDHAARLAAGDPAASGAGAPITALDVCEALPRAVAALRGAPESSRPTS